MEARGPRPYWGGMGRAWLYLVGFVCWGQLRRSSVSLWTAAAVTGVVVIWVALETHAGRWELRQRRMVRNGPRYGQFWQCAVYEHLALTTGSTAGPTGAAVAAVCLGVAPALQAPLVQQRWGFMNFSIWVIHGVYLGFLLPVLTLACVHTFVDAENEAWVWIWSRPLPRSGLYLAQWLGTLPWSVAVTLGSLGGLALAGGTFGHLAWQLYLWPALIGTLAFTALFHVIHVFFRRPVVIGLIYVFFFEYLIGSLPGSLKQLSLTFHTRSLMYNSAQIAGYPVEMLPLTDPSSPVVAWWVLGGATVALLCGGAWLYRRWERWPT
ncbi:MAG: hypothetical protein NZ703_07085 [Gemmataceae bacterium]|nr:hypothetical protein [Gemmataceae bacterium]MDW8242939.1 hypothetical protein [Thermogemmata sp.]